MLSNAFASTSALILLLMCLVSVDHTSSKVIANFVLPHGGIALDPSYFNTTNSTAKQEAWEIHWACKKIGNEIADMKPGLVLLSTPHGIADLKNFAFFLNPKAQGYADTDNCKCPPCCYNASVNIDVKTTQDIVNSLGFQRNVTAISGFGPPGQSDEPFPLRWGEVIPFHFIPGVNWTQVIILSQPSRRYTHDVEMVPELLELGASLFQILEASKKRVVVIISADLAHTHDASGPYGYSNTSEPFDQACGHWASTLETHSLLVTASSLVDKALSCGFTGLVTLHGLMTAGNLSSWQPSLLVNHHPSYYGMMVAAFYRHNDSRQFSYQL